MAKAAPVFSAKQRIDHAVFGTGTIVEVNPHYTTISFDESGKKKFVTRILKMVPSDVPAPEKPVRRKKATTTAAKPKTKKKAKKKAVAAK